jgi:AraC family transcriptional regulator
VLAKPAAARHSNRYGPTGARALLIEFTDEGSLLDPFAAQLYSSVRLTPAGVAGLTVRRLLAGLPDRAPGWQLQMQSRILDLALLLLRAENPRVGSRRQNWLATVADRLRSEFARPPSLESLALEAGVHPVYLCKAFRSRYQCSPGEFVRHVRLERARSLLEETDESVSAIAFSAGFSDHSHLTRQFRAAVGVTPARYRLEHRPEKLYCVPADVHIVQARTSLATLR